MVSVLVVVVLVAAAAGCRVVVVVVLVVGRGCGFGCGPDCPYFLWLRFFALAVVVVADQIIWSSGSEQRTGL